MTPQFNDAIHEDLFDLLIMNVAFFGTDIVVTENVLEQSRTDKIHENLRDILYSENHPKEYECKLISRNYVGEYKNGVSRVQMEIEHGDKAGPFIYPGDKIKITL